MRARRIHRCIVFSCLVLVGGCTIGKLTLLNFKQLFKSSRPVEERITQPHIEGAELAVLWVGHATVLVQLGDKWILTDPVFTATVGQLSKRLVEPGIAVDDLPPIDAVLISHMHFDHLSQGSLQMIEHLVGRLYVPRQASVYLPGFDFPIHELGHGERFEHDGLEITAEPVAHDASRYRVDGDWLRQSATAYVVRYRGVSLFFGGDSAYHPHHFKRAGQRHAGIDLAILPIAPIEPHDFMGSKHMNPAQAVQVWEELGARWMLPVHYDTFVNGLDRVGDAERLLREAVARRPGGEQGLVLLGIGERRLLLP